MDNISTSGIISVLILVTDFNINPGYLDGVVDASILWGFEEEVEEVEEEEVEEEEEEVQRYLLLYERVCVFHYMREVICVFICVRLYCLLTQLQRLLTAQAELHYALPVYKFLCWTYNGSKISRIISLNMDLRIS